MTRKSSYILLSILCFFVSESCLAQYYVSGVDPVYLKWQKIVDKERGPIIFPDYIREKAFTISFYRDTLSRVIDYNIATKKRRFPITLHPTNMLSNGMVTYTPQRMELYTMPSRDNFSLPWLKQLVAHEYRHVAQLSNLNHGFTKIFSYVIGEQMLGLTAILMPSYFYEGDAVVAETQFSMYGRGKQPSFNMPLIAILMEEEKFSPRKYKLGTINQYSPDAYLMGYYMTQYATKKYGDDFWRDVLRFGARNPYLIDPCYFAYRKYGNKTSSIKMISEMAVELRDFWREQSSIDNSSVIIPTKTTSYTTYSSPFYVNDSSIIAHKSDFDRAGRFVKVDPDTGEEKILLNTGYLSSLPLSVNNRIYWGEIVPSFSWGQKNSSSIFYADLENEKLLRPKKIKTLKGNFFFFTPYKEGGFVAVEYDKINNPHIVIISKNFEVINSHPVEGSDISFNGLCYDNTTDMIYGAVVDDRGTSLIKLNKKTNKIENLTPPNYGTITNLSAADGKLYYTSIDSGKEEVQVYDLEKEQEYRLTTSRYGSQAAIAQNGTMLMTTYTPKGHLLATQKIGGMKETEWQKMPSDVMNFPQKSWDVPKLDTINFTGKVESDYHSTKKVKKYNKALNAAHIHSWIPFYVDINKIIDDGELRGGVGINLLSQNLLNSVIAWAGYGRVKGENIWTANLKYVGLPVHLTFNLESGGQDQETYNFIMLGGTQKKYLELGGELSLPLNLSSNGNNRFLTMAVEYNYLNSMVYTSKQAEKITIGGTENMTTPNLSRPIFKEGIHRTTARITFQNTLKTSRKALNPRWGYVFQLNNTMSPFNSDFSNVLSLFGRTYLPGPFAHGSFTIEAGYQYQTTTPVQYTLTTLRPRGVDYYAPIKRSYATTLDYRVPLFYPNGGLGSFMNFQRISIAGFVDYSRYQTFNYNKWRNATSYGGSLIVAVNLLGINNLFNIDFSLFKPSGKPNPMFEVGFNISI